MSFVSFNLNFYKEKIERYENCPLTQADLLEAKRLLKMVDDLIDEGYFELFSVLQEQGGIVDRLKKVIECAGERPFSTILRKATTDVFRSDQTEFAEYLNGLTARASEVTPCADEGFLHEIVGFCNSIEYDESCAYVFLLRDALLPYLYFANQGRKNLFPLLLSRRFLNLLCNNAGVDDVVRSAVFEALENGCKDFESFIAYCKKAIVDKLSPFPNVTQAVKDLLKKIDSEKIVVVETGCYGTFPLLLCALDERVDFRMYTTVLYLFETYKDRIFTTSYENLRLFETLLCQNNLFQLTGFAQGEFFVSENESKSVVEKALGEISLFLKIQKGAN